MEHLDIELTRHLTPKALEERLNETLPEGICVTDIRLIGPSTPAVSASVEGYVYSVVVQRRHEELEGPAADFLASTSHPVLRSSPKGTKTVDIRPFVRGLSLHPVDGQTEVIMELADDGGRTAKPGEVIGAMTGMPDDDIAILRVVRRAVVLKENLALAGKRGS